MADLYDEGDEVLLAATVFRANTEQALIEFKSMEGPFSVRVPLSALSSSVPEEGVRYLVQRRMDANSPWRSTLMETADPEQAWEFLRMCRSRGQYRIVRRSLTEVPESLKVNS